MMVVELLNDPPPSKSPSGAERRRSRRHTVALDATLLSVDEQDRSNELKVQVRDISLHGAGIRCGVPLAAGDMCFLDIGAGPLKLHSRVRITASRKRRDGSYDIGAEFC